MFFTNHMALVRIISSSPMEVLSGGSQSTYAYASLGPTRDVVLQWWCGSLIDHNDSALCFVEGHFVLG